MDKNEEAIAKVPTLEEVTKLLEEDTKLCAELRLKIQVLSERAKNGDLDAIRILEREDSRVHFERLKKKIEDISAAMENLHM